MFLLYLCEKWELGGRHCIIPRLCTLHNQYKIVASCGVLHVYGIIAGKDHNFNTDNDTLTQCKTKSNVTSPFHQAIPDIDNASPQRTAITTDMGHTQNIPLWCLPALNMDQKRTYTSCRYEPQ